MPVPDIALRARRVASSSRSAKSTQRQQQPRLPVATVPTTTPARFANRALLTSDPALASKSRADLQAEIKELALRAISADPLNARAFTLLAGVTDDPAQSTAYMRAAISRSRRQSGPVFSMMHRAYEDQDYAKSLQYADILFRSRPELNDFVTRYLSQFLVQPDARQLLVAKLSQDPPWRTRFLQTLIRVLAKQPQTIAPLFTELRAVQSPPGDRAFNAYLNRLIDVDRVTTAYEHWAQIQSADTLNAIGFVNNASFETIIADSPFDWSIGRSRNAVIEAAASADAPDGRRVLDIRFQGARARLGRVRQVLVLGAGKYQLTGIYRGRLTAKRGLRWRLRCLSSASRARLGQTEQIRGQVREWTRFTTSFNVPSTNCQGQSVELVHDARSASEQLISGRISFDQIRIRRLPATE